MINKIFNELIINSYSADQNCRQTLAFITNFQYYLGEYIRRRGTVYKINGPIAFDEGNQQNENNLLISEPKSIFFGVDNLFAELSVGNRKWSRILATNMQLKQNEILIVDATSFNFTRQINSCNAATENELIVTIPALMSDYNEKSFAVQVRKVYLALLKIVEKTFIKCEIKIPTLGKNIMMLNLNEVNYFDEQSLEKEIITQINSYDDCIGIYNIPKERQKNFFFKYDVYDHKFFVRFYGCNKYTTSIIDLIEISLTVHNNVYDQCRHTYLNEYKESNYYARIVDKTLNNYLQIKFNLAKIYLFFLQKYTINEVTSSPTLITDLQRYWKKKIETL